MSNSNNATQTDHSSLHSISASPETDFAQLTLANPKNTIASRFDLAKFLRELPRVDEKDVPQEPEDVCSICHVTHGQEDPDTGYTEFPVRLPCNHIVGKACIIKWLKKGPKGGNANSCPICRHQIFQPWPRTSRPDVPVRIPQRATPRSPTRARPPGRIEAITPGRGVQQQFDMGQFRSQLQRGNAGRILRTGSITYSRSAGIQGATNRHLERHVRAVEDAGLYIGPFMGEPNTDANRLHVGREHAANRRRIAMAERDLSNFVVRQEIGFPAAPGIVGWEDNEPLDAIQDQLLFEWLQDHYAFQGLQLNEDFRKEKAGPRAGRAREDAEVWEVLRSEGCYWEANNDRNGRWRKRQGPLYTEAEEVQSDTFQELSSGGAFLTEGVREEFAGHDKYYILRRLLQMGITWDFDRGVWAYGGGPPLYGDRVQTTRRQGQFLNVVDLPTARRLGMRASMRALEGQGRPSAH